jgi:hypothetical protein
VAVATLNEVMAALATQIRTVVTAATTLDVQVEPGMVVNPTPPTIDVWPADPPYGPDAGFGDLVGGDRLTVRARIGTGDNDAGQDVIYDLMDHATDMSLAGAIASDPTLGGVANLDVEAVSGLRQYGDPGDAGLYLGFEVTVLAFRTVT